MRLKRLAGGGVLANKGAMTIYGRIFLISAFFLAVLHLTGLAATARAQTVVETEYATTELLAETDGVVPGETLWFAFRQEVREGWHVFWENPGDAGLPLELRWTLPEGFAAGDILHPIPKYIPVGPLASFAHEGEPVFLTSVTAPADLQPGQHATFSVDASWQVCEEICVPEDGRFSLTLPIATPAEVARPHQSVFEAARAALPAAFDGDAAFAARGGAYVLDMQAPEGFSAEGAFFFPAPEGLIKPAGEQEATVADGRLTVSMTPGYAPEYDADALKGVLAFAGADGARRGLAVRAAVDGPLASPQDAPAVPLASAEANIPLLFVLAFFGGLILNIMPCVFPIIFVKAASLMQTAGEDMARVRRHGVLYTAGVVATFLLMGAVLLILRAGGEQLGWGFHLQSPLVTALSAYVLFMVGLNLAGLFSVGEGLAGVGDGLASRGGGIGAFFTGALAVVVAAPCIGPLLTAPIGAVVLQPPAIGLSILVAMALGLAAPYLALTLAPGLGRALPRPGAWMTVMKQALAFPVFAAAAYFLWVFAQQTTATGLALILAGGVLLAFAAWLFEISKGEGGRAFAVRALSALAVLVALAPLTRLEPAAASTASADDLQRHGAFEAEPYSAEALAAYRAAGAPVFVDFTAAWCVTCQFNKATVFSSRDLARDFEREGVVFMVADWTLRDAAITEALQGFGASGVPLYAYYAPDGGVEVLPLPLTREGVRKTVLGERAAGQS